MVSQGIINSLIKDSHIFDYGITTGVFWAVASYMLLFAISQLLANGKKYASQLFILGALSAAFFALFHTYSISLFKPFLANEKQNLFILIGSAVAPLGVMCDFRMFIQSIPITSLSGFLAWEKFNNLASVFYAFCLFSFFLLLVFIDNPKIVLNLSFLTMAINNFIGVLVIKKTLDQTIVTKSIMMMLGMLSVGLISAMLLFNIIDFQTIPIVIFNGFDWLFCLLFLLYYFTLTQFIINQSLLFKKFSRFNAVEFYRNVYHALKNDEFFIEYQPKIILKSKEICGFEALIRWHHPTMGLISPCEFIPMAEQSDIINDICRWVIIQVIEDIKYLRNKSINNDNDKMNDLPVSINFSINNLNTEMIEFLYQQLLKNQLPTSTVIIELTESLLLELTTERQQALNKIQEYNIYLSLDDFGAGYSSLRYVDEMGLNEVKIDKSLVNNVLDNKKQKIIATIMSLCDSLDILVVAEGLNDLTTHQKFLDMNCLMGQGFGICRPKTLSELNVWLDNYDTEKFIYTGCENLDRC